MKEGRAGWECYSGGNVIRVFTNSRNLRLCRIFLSKRACALDQPRGASGRLFCLTIPCLRLLLRRLCRKGTFPCVESFLSPFLQRVVAETA